MIVADFANALAHLVEMGRRTGVRLLSFGYARPPETIAKALGLAEHERAQHSVRVRLIDGSPFSYLTTHVPERIGVTYSEADLATKPLLELLERSGVRPERATQTIGAALAAPDMARALELDVGAPLIELTRVVIDGDGRGVEHLHAFYRPDRYSFRMDLVRSGEDGERTWSPVNRNGKQQPERRTKTGRPQRARKRNFAS